LTGEAGAGQGTSSQQQQQQQQQQYYRQWLGYGKLIHFVEA